MSYNGWDNYETWAVKCWLDNEEGTYEHARTLTEHLSEPGHLATGIKDWVEEMMPDLGASLAADLLGAVLSKVAWYEIAQAYLEDFAPIER